MKISTMLNGHHQSNSSHASILHVPILLWLMRRSRSLTTANLFYQAFTRVKRSSEFLVSLLIRSYI